MKHLLVNDWRRPLFLNYWPILLCGDLLAICPSPSHKKLYAHAQLLSKQSWHFFELNQLLWVRKLHLFVLLSTFFITFNWSWRLFSRFCTLLGNSIITGLSCFISSWLTQWFFLWNWVTLACHVNSTRSTFRLQYYCQSLGVTWRCLAHDKN